MAHAAANISNGYSPLKPYLHVDDGTSRTNRGVDRGPPTLGYFAESYQYVT